MLGPDFSDALRRRQLEQASALLPGPDYYSVLKWIHRLHRPSTYVEIGVRCGSSLRIADPSTVCAGLDPKPEITCDLPPATKVYPITSDQFFETYSVQDALGVQNFDLAFIDGLHLFEQALRDFINLERWAGPRSLVMIHDCLPLDDVTSARTRMTQFYSGDVWKLVAALSRYRPDLRLAIIRTAPTGLCLAANLDASSAVLTRHYDEIVSEFRDKSWSDRIEHGSSLPGMIDNTPEAVEKCLSELFGGGRGTAI